MALESPTWLLSGIIVCLLVNNQIRVVLSKPKTADIFINAPINIDIEVETEVSGTGNNVDLSINGDVFNNNNGAETDQMEPLSEPACSCEDCSCGCRNCTGETNGGEEITTQG